jgi:hypothetical protein
MLELVTTALLVVVATVVVGVSVRVVATLYRGADQ